MESGFFAADRRGFFPGTLRPLGFRQITVPYPVIHVAVTHGSERLVVQADTAHGFAQLFRKLVNGLEVVG
jgi:hypothetical protein